MTHIPSWWSLLLLSLAVCRVTRLVGWDDLTIPLRRRVTGLGDEAHKQWAHVIDAQRQVGADPWNVDRGEDGWATLLARRVERATGSYQLPPLVADGRVPTPPVSERRYYLSKLLRCPWCVGFWISALAWLAWLAWPHGVIVASVPFAISEIVGLVSKNLDA